MVLRDIGVNNVGESTRLNLMQSESGAVRDIGVSNGPHPAFRPAVFVIQVLAYEDNGQGPT